MATGRSVMERGDEARRGEWASLPERAPSVMVKDEPWLARWIGTLGLALVLLGAICLLINLGASTAEKIGVRTLLSPGWATLFIVLGMGFLLYHSASDSDVQVRRTYAVFGFLWLGAGLALSLIPYKEALGGLFLPWGLVCFTLALLFLVAFTRFEEDDAWLRATFWTLGGVGAALAVIGYVLGSLKVDFLLPYGLILVVLGLLYWWAFAGLTGISTGLGYRAALAIGGLGGLVFLVALGRSIFTSHYLMPSGLVLMGCGLLYGVLALGLCSDNRLIVMTRRELAAIFYSPIAYIVLFGFTVMGWQVFNSFIDNLWQDEPLRGVGRPIPTMEPIVIGYFVAWFPVICVLFIVPVLTMRLLSEEKRTGTIEVMLTAPLDETALVLSKFIAAFIFFMLLWVPWWLYLVALRVEGGTSFEYSPLISFIIALACTGASFVSMGVFFSSLTRNQVAAAIMTFVGMFVLTLLFFLKQRLPRDESQRIVLEHISYIDLWINSLLGRLAPRDLLFHLSATVFWLFLSVKVLESRKWR